MTQLSNVPMQPNPNAVERPMTLIEKLERECDRLHKLSADFSHDTRLRLINEALGICRAIKIVKQHEAESEVQDD